MEEVWKDIPGYNGKYKASNTGKIKSIHNNGKTIILKPDDNHGYDRVQLYGNKNKKVYRVHRLIAITFIGKSVLPINHKDGNKKNNNVINLEYCTTKQNNDHAFLIGKMPHSENHPKSKLNNSQVFFIRSNIKKRGDIKNIAKMFGVTRQCVSLVFHNHSWKRLFEGAKHAGK